MLTAFKGLKPFQLSEYIFLALFAFFVPISWRIATYLMIGLFICTILKGVFEEGFKVNKSQYQNKTIYIISIAFWALYAMSFFYSENTTEARIQIGKKLSFLLFPLFFMTSNLSYLTKDRIRTIMYCFVWGILTLFIINFFWATYDVIINDSGIDRLTSPHKFFKTNYTIFTFVHRAYFSIMTCMGFVFCLSEIFSNTSVKLKTFNITSCIFLILIPFFLTSRAGILCTILTLFSFWWWITFIKRRKTIGLLSGIIIIFSLAICYFAFPKSISRFYDTFNNIKNGKGDCRITIRNANRSVIANNILFGVGIGDRNKETLNSYNEYKDIMVSKMTPDKNVDYEYFICKRTILLDSIHSKFENEHTDDVYKYIDSIAYIDNCDYSSIKENLTEYQITKHCIKYELNAHNQFSDTIIAVGIIGLLLLLGFFIMPFYLWIKNKNFDIVFFSLLFIIAFNCLFESVFERQMGIMFFTFFYFLLFHANFCQQSTDNGQQSSSTI